MNKQLPIVAAIINGVLVGSALVATRFAIDQTTPSMLALLRYVIGLACLLLPASLAGRPRFAPRDLAPMALLGVAQFGVVVGLLNYALQFIPSARAALLFATFPLLTMLIAALAGYERMTLVKTAGTLVAIGGVALALGDKALSGGGSGGWAGEIAALLSALTGAICSVLYRLYLRKYKTVSVSAYAMAAAVFFLAVMAALDGSLGAGWLVFTPGAWGAVLFIGVNSGIGYYLWLWALSRAAATNVTVFLTLSPVTAAVLGALLLAEPLPLATVAGIMAVVGGLVLALRRK